MPFKISTLLFIHNEQGELLLIKRRKSPNLGLWSCPGGKLEMSVGESPYEAAVREIWEEARFSIETSDLRLFCMISEKNYEGDCHWLMFLFHCVKPIPELPADIDEGVFGFHAPDTIDSLEIPETDRQTLWPLYRKHRGDFVALRADCDPGKPLEIIVEEVKAG